MNSNIEEKSGMNDNFENKGELSCFQSLFKSPPVFLPVCLSVGTLKLIIESSDAFFKTVVSVQSLKNMTYCQLSREIYY